jgi:uncharacterized membrane protein YesL
MSIAHTVPPMPRSREGSAIVWESVSLAARLFWRRLPTLVLANIVWLLVSLLVVTWPAATAGLFTLVRRIVEEELDAAPHEARMSDFWEGFKLYWARSTLLIFIDVAGFAIIAVALLFYGRSPAEPLRWLIGPIGLAALVWTGAQLYVYPLLLHRVTGRPWEIMREALLMAIGYPLVTLPLLGTSLVLTAAAVVLAGPVLFVFFSAMAMVQTVALRLLMIQRGEVFGEASGIARRLD